MVQQLRFRTVFAGTANAALALTGCGQDGGDASDSQSSAAPEAATDYTAEQVESTLAAASVAGEAIPDVSSLSSSQSQEVKDGLEGMQSLFESAEFDPAQCQDVFTDKLSAGLSDDVIDDASMGQIEDDVIVTAYPLESEEAADQHVSDLRDQQDLCGEISVSVMDVTTELTTTTEDQDIEGAGEAIVQESVGAQEGTEDSTFRSGVMSVGNVVVTVSVMEEGDQDLGSALSDIAPTFVDGPAEPSEGASESASEEASDSQS